MEKKEISKKEFKRILTKLKTDADNIAEEIMGSNINALFFLSHAPEPIRARGPSKALNRLRKTFPHFKGAPKATSKWKGAWELKAEVVNLWHFTRDGCLWMTPKTKVLCLCFTSEGRYYTGEHFAGKCPWKKKEEIKDEELSR